MDSLTTFLYAKPTFIDGIARILDFGSTLQEYNSCFFDEQADNIAMKLDWAMVGEDFRHAMRLISEEEKLEVTEALLTEARSLLLASTQ
jgi:hypothetical protein